MHAYNHSTQEAETGGSPVQGQPWLHSETLSQIKTENKAKSNFQV
jgi:hypothetical protein